MMAGTRRPLASAPELPTKRFKGADGQKAASSETYEVRYRLPIEAEAALTLNGSELEGYTVSVRPDETSKDGTKVIVTGLPAAMGTEELKGLFSGAGQVVFAGPPKKAFGKGGGGSTAATAVGEVRYETPEEAAQAMAKLDGSTIDGLTITAMLDQSSKDNSKLIITGLPGTIQWQELKDHCMQAGRVAYCGVKSGLPLGGMPAGGQMGGCMMGGCPGGNTFQAFGAAGMEAEVRFDDPQHALQAVEQLNNSNLSGAAIKIRADPNSKDRTRILVSGFPANVQWQELKDHFAVIGTVAFAQVKSPQPAMQACGGLVQWGGKQGMPMGGKGMFGNAAMMGGGCFGGAYVNQPQQWYGQPAMIAGFGGGFGGWGGCNAFAPTGKGKGKGGAGGGGIGGSGEVRYDMPGHARIAIAKLNGSFLQGSRLTVSADESSVDGSKVIVHGIPPGCQWQEVKDHFAQVGQVAFASIVGPGEVRMETPQEALRAQQMLNGSTVFGSTMSVVLDNSSKDRTRLLVTGLPSSITWQQLKDVFGQAGTVAFVTRQEAK